MRLKPSFPRIRRGNPQAAGLELFVPFTEGRSQPADAVRQDRVYAIQGGESWVNGQVGPAMRFPNGTNVGLSLPVAAFTGSQPRTIVSRIRIDGAINSVGNGVFSIDPGDVGATGQRWSFCVRSGRVLRIEIEGAGYNSSLAVPAGEWSTVSCRLSGSTLGSHILGLNGTYESASGSLSVNTNSSYNTRIGTFADSTSRDRELVGEIDWIAGFSRVLTESEIDQLNHDPFDMFRPRQRSYFAFFAGGAVGTPTGSATLGVEADLTASGKTTPKASASLSTEVDLSAAGKITPKAATEADLIFTFTAVGSAPATVSQGSASLDTTVTLSASGQATPKASGSLGIESDLTAAGKTAPKASAVSSVEIDFVATGSAPTITAQGFAVLDVSVSLAAIGKTQYSAFASLDLSIGLAAAARQSTPTEGTLFLGNSSGFIQPLSI